MNYIIKIIGVNIVHTIKLIYTVIALSVVVGKMKYRDTYFDVTLCKLWKKCFSFTLDSRNLFKESIIQHLALGGERVVSVG